MNKKIMNLTLAAIFAALTFAVTFLTKIPFPVVGYGHIGDSIVYVASALLPAPFAMAASAIGAGFSDFLSGTYANYTPFTMVIKALMSLMIVLIVNKSKNESYLNKILAVILAGAINVGGYMLADYIISGYSIGTALTYAPLNIVQSLASGIVFIIIIPFINIVYKKFN